MGKHERRLVTALHHTDLKTLNDTFLFSTKLITTFISKSTKQKIKSQEYSYSECDSALQVSLNQTKQLCFNWYL